MGIRFILGKPGTGKTTLCLREIHERLDGNAPLYYLVPEQFSLQSEKLLLHSNNDLPRRAAATSVQVLSFNRLAYRLFSVLGGASGKIADDLGKQMLLRKVLFDVAEKLTYYKSAADKHGFVDSLAHTITEMNQYCVTAEDLRLRAKNSTNLLAAKLMDIAEIYSAYRQLVTGRYLLTDDMLNILSRKLWEMEDENAALPLLDGAYFWVDGFSGFTPQERQVINLVTRRAKCVSITLTTDLQASSLSPPQITMDRLTQLAKKNHIPIENAVYMNKNFRHEQNEKLAHFVENFTIMPTKHQRSPTKQKQSTNAKEKFSQNFSNNNSIKLISAPDRYAAVNTAARYILQMQQEGYSFRDIAILCGDRAKYEKVLQTTFDRLNIPLFVDTETDILSHPLTELIRSALDIIVRNWNYESVFRFLKTRMTNLPADVVDILENYALANGIASYRWQRPFTEPTAEKARVELLEILANFAKTKNRASSRDTVQNHCRRIFDMLYALHVPNTLQRWYETHTANGDHAAAKIHIQIWPKICEIFDKLVEMLGDEIVTVKTFAATLDAGFSQVGLGRVPPTVNQVVLGDIGRSRYPQIKAMIVLGANENVLPPAPQQTGLFTDIERQALRGAGVELATDSIHAMAESYYSLYCALSQPTEKLFLVYTEAETNGKPLRPSPLITRLDEMFSDLKVESAPEIIEYETVNTIQVKSEKLTQKSASRLYSENIITAASRLESYARCPFSYFMTYVIKAKPRKEFEILYTDLGNLFHSVLEQFSKQAWENGDKDAVFSRDEISKRVSEIIETLTETSNLFQQTARNRHVLNKVRRVSVSSIWALCEHIKLGEFTPTFAEQEIRTNNSILLSNGKTLNLTGFVDRVDILQASDGDYIKIIDYKSGSTKFSIEEVRKGIQLQLMIYMNVLASTRNAKPGGVFYFPIDDPVITTDTILNEETREKELLKQFKMSGIALANDVTITGLDRTIAPGTNSNIIPVAINKDGRYKKTSQPAVLELEEFLDLGQEVNNKIKELGERMIYGDISAEPFTKGTKSPCNFCEFGAICGKRG